MTPAEQIKQVGLRAGARVVGIASAAAFRETVPEGYRPEDILPGAMSVVVAGGDGPTAGAWRCPDHRVMEITGYDLRENIAVHVMCDHIERELGHYAIQAPSLSVHGHQPPMSMMHAAELAGLGTRSLAAHIRPESLELIRRDLAPPEAPDENIKGVDLLIVGPGIRLHLGLPGQLFGLGDVEVRSLRFGRPMFAHGVSREEEVDPPSAESESNRQAGLPFSVPGPLGQPDLLRLVDLDDVRILNDDLNVTGAHAAYRLH
jgi:hypothetical protein